MTVSNDASSLTRLMRAFLVAAFAIAALAVAGCGDDDDDDGDSGGTTEIGAVAVNQAAVDKLPQAIRDKGELTVATDASYPPNEFFDEDGETIIGMDPDLAKALGETLDLDLKLQNVGFDAILPGLAAGKYDIALSSFTDTKEREKTVDMVTYLTAGTGFYTNADNPTDVSDLSELCGKTVAVEKGTTQADDAEAQSEKCESEGSKPVKVDVFPDQNGANLAVETGRAQVGMADSPVAAYIVKQSGGKLVKSDGEYGSAPYGIAISKDTDLTEAIQLAVQSLIDNGTYAEILDKWGLGDAAIETSKINDGVE